jgi:3-oxoacyl-[acyl-carrier-protein] synthase III
MPAIVAVSSYLPGVQVPIEDLGSRLGLTEMQVKVFRRYHKLGLARRAPGVGLLDLLRGALSRLEGWRGREQHVRYVLYARSMPVVVPYPMNPLHELCAEAGLGHAEAFTVTHQVCASGLQALDLAGRLVNADPDPQALAIVLAGEKAFTSEAELIPETSFFGEGASACLVRASGERDRQLSYYALMRGDFDGEYEDVAGEFQRDYADLLADAVLAAIERAGLGVPDIALILPHNVNLIAWRRVCQRLGFPLERVVQDNIATQGHVFCADAFVNYQTARETGRLKPGQRYVVAAAGQGRGATFSAMVFEH